MPYKDPIIAKQKRTERWERWAKRNPEKANSRMREWRHRNPKNILLLSAKRRAKEKNIEFSLTLSDIPDIPKMCPVAQIPIFVRPDKAQGPCENSPTLDRVNPNKGYVKGNVQVLSFKGNRWKSDMSYEDVHRLLKYIENHD